MANIIEVLIRAKDEASAVIDKIGVSTKTLAVSGAGMVAAGTAMGGALLSMAQAGAAAGDAASDAAQRLGIATAKVGGFQLAATLADTSFQALSSGMGKLAKDAADGGDKLRDLGISVTDANGKMKPMDQLLFEVSDKFAGMRDGSEKTATAIDLFGKSGAELIPILNGGSEGFKAAQAQAELYHLAIGEEAAADAAAFADAQDELGLAMTGVSNTVSQALVPSLTTIVVETNAALASLSGFVAAHPGAVQAVGGLAVALTGTGGLLVGLAGVGAAAPLISTGLTNLGFAGATLGAQFTALAASPALFVAALAVLAAELAYCIKLITDMNSARAAAATANDQADKGLVTNIANLKKLGIEYNGTGKTIKEQEVEVAKLTRTYFDQHRAVQTTTEEHKLTREEIERAKAEFDKFRSAVDSVKTSVMGDKDATRALLTAVGELRAEHVSDEAIAKQLGTRFTEIYNTLLATNQAIPPVVAQFAAIEIAQKAILAQGPLKLIPADLKKQTDDYSAAQKQIADERALQIANIDLAETQSVVDTLAGLKSIADQALADEITRTTLSNNLALLEQTNADAIATDYEAAATRYDTAWTSATESISAGITTAFSDALFNGGNFKEDMVDLLKNTGQGMLDSLTEKFVKPFTDALAQIISNLGQIALSALGIGAGPAGGILGGVTGTGGSLNGILGGAGAGLSGFGSAAAAFLTNPITIAAGAALGVGILWSKSQAHHEANSWVQNFQNPFDSTMARINESGQAPDTILALKSAHVADYLAAMMEFSTHGSDEKTVAQQAYATFLHWYGDPSQYGVSIPQFRSGVEYLGNDTFAMLHQGEAVLTKEQNAARMSGGGGEGYGRVCGLLEQLIAKVDRLGEIDGKAVTRVVAGHLNDFSRFDGVTFQGA